MTTTSSWMTDYVEMVEACDVHAATDFVVDLLDGGTPLHRIVEEVLVPAQLRVGQLWESGRWSVADEHVATSITEAALSALTYAATTRQSGSGRHVIVACAEGEWHSLPARMAALVAGATGQVRVTMLGPSLPAEQLHQRLSAGDIDLLALSCTMPTNLVGAVRCVAAAHDLGIPVIAGGRALGDGPHRSRAIGADGWGKDAQTLLGPLPPLVGVSRDVPAEVLWLDGADGAHIDLAYDRMTAAFPRLHDMTSYEQDRTREDLGWIVRHTAAALLTDDVRIVEDSLTWLVERLRGFVAPEVITTTAHLLAETVEAQAPAGTAILHRAATTVENTPRGAGSA
ncbi:cobalamin B12-binding domain-containing protein [Aeromicrobium wangtongii]|uniref:cobalamin B12-binding domain-containing protein n=1 Tax=Aeromicrobium wangtongii TaxID=2969247 RepID=UPI002016B0EE|nr:cobalamin B12-binding domain-containing protein [Aeromicrobium wangtongii]MCL3819321.1 cobalamin-dependent protein [Aeromicrobium wangtongii]